MKKILSLGKKFVPGCTFLLVLIALNAFAPAHNSPIKSNLNTQIDQDDFITGTVSDLGGPIPGVLITVKNTNISAVTDENGHYTISALPGDILIFSYEGYETIELEVGIDPIIDVELYEAVALEEAVINAGYYQVKDRERTGSISRITAEEIENQPVGNVLAAIQGRMPGVNIIQNSGTPGGGFEVQIRGINSLRREGNYPLYIIDGVPVNASTPSFFGSRALPYAEINPLNSINPNDIESIEVLKDADATAIYGSRGANGVILINTKKAKSDRTNFSFQSSYSISQLGKKMKMMNTDQYIEMRKYAFQNDGISEYPANAFDLNGAWNSDRYTNWQDQILGKTAAGLNLQFTLSGGKDKTHYLLSGSHNEQQTVFSNKFLYKYNNLVGNFSHKSDDSRLELNVSGLFSAQQNDIINGDLTNSALTLSPNAPKLYDENHNLNWENNTFENPLAIFESTYDNESIDLNSNLNLRYELFPSFFLKFNGGINYQEFEETVLRPSTMYNPSMGVTPASSSITRGNRRYLSYLLEPQLNYKTTFKNHELDILIGGTFQQSNSSYLGLYASGFETNSLITNLAAANNLSVTNDDLSQYNYAALFGRINYQFRNKYILNLTGRRDGSSRFGPNNRFANFGAVGIAWIFSQENLLKDLSWLSFGKLRGSFGITGNDLIGDYQYLDTYGISSNQYGGNSGLYPSRLYNPDFSWEKTQKTEFAVELGFIKNRLNLFVNRYENKSGNQLVGIPLPGTTGFSSVQANLDATVKNTGWEFVLTAKPISGKSFLWETNFNISFPKNKLVSFPNLEGSTYTNKYVIGQPVTIVKVYNFEGIDPETGLYSFTDYNNDGNLSASDDAQAIRNLGIRYTGGWSNQFSYRNWKLSFLFQFVKQLQWNYNNIMKMPGTFYNQPVEVLNVWSASNPKGQYMPYSTGMNPEISQRHLMFMNSTAAISDASFIRLKNIQINYQIPLKQSEMRINVFVQGQNLLTFTDYFGLDPEFRLGGYLPPLKTYAFGFQLTF
ncbi:MAG: SusC/RagA family TonB-linked outer membrane protein [Weeksellaceae bacterium]